MGGALRNPLFVYVGAMTLLCAASIAAVIWAIRSFHRDSVIEDPTVEDLEALYRAPFITEDQRVPIRGRRP